MYAVTLGSFKSFVTLVIKNPPNNISAMDIIIIATGERFSCILDINSNNFLKLR